MRKVARSELAKTGSIRTIIRVLSTSPGVAPESSSNPHSYFRSAVFVSHKVASNAGSQNLKLISFLQHRNIKSLQSW